MRCPWRSCFVIFTYTPPNQTAFKYKRATPLPYIVVKKEKLGTHNNGTKNDIKRHNNFAFEIALQLPFFFFCGALGFDSSNPKAPLRLQDALIFSFAAWKTFLLYALRLYTLHIGNFDFLRHLETRFAAESNWIWKGVAKVLCWYYYNNCSCFGNFAVFVDLPVAVNIYIYCLDYVKLTENASVIITVPAVTTFAIALRITATAQLIFTVDTVVATLTVLLLLAANFTLTVDTFYLHIHSSCNYCRCCC